MTKRKPNLATFIAELQEATEGFDLYGFDARLAAALGIELPNDYAQRKAEEEGLAVPVSPLDLFSMGRKLVAMLGDGWTWSAEDNGPQSHAEVWPIDLTYPASTVDGPAPVALRLAALNAMLAQ